MDFYFFSRTLFNYQFDRSSLLQVQYLAVKPYFSLQFLQKDHRPNVPIIFLHKIQLKHFTSHPIQVLSKLLRTLKMKKSTQLHSKHVHALNDQSFYQ